jgi:lipopolysaccharide export system protein LptA
MSRKRIAVSVVCSLAAIGAAPLSALESDRNQPMRIRSDRSEADLGKDSTLLIGNVQITQGTLEVRAERADITQSKGEVSRAVLTGTPATLKQQVDTGGELRAQARTIDYALANETVELTGGVVIERPQGTLRSERVVYSVKDGKVVAGDSAGGVELIIPPRASTEPKAN